MKIKDLESGATIVTIAAVVSGRQVNIGNQPMMHDGRVVLSQMTLADGKVMHGAKMTADAVTFSSKVSGKLQGYVLAKPTWIAVHAAALGGTSAKSPEVPATSAKSAEVANGPKLGMRMVIRDCTVYASSMRNAAVLHVAKSREDAKAWYMANAF